MLPLSAVTVKLAPDLKQGEIAYHEIEGEVVPGIVGEREGYLAFLPLSGPVMEFLPLFNLSSRALVISDCEIEVDPTSAVTASHANDRGVLTLSSNGTMLTGRYGDQRFQYRVGGPPVAPPPAAQSFLHWCVVHRTRDARIVIATI
jgi:hypothetical protein